MARHYRELLAWQLATQLRWRIWKMTRPPHPTGDLKFVTDIRGSSRSVASNIAEGHARFNPKENARFLEIAKASLDETENHLLDGKSCGHFSSADFDEAHSLVRRLTVAVMRLLWYLRSPQAEENAKKIRARLERTRRTR